jgi:hypothetical protein
MMAHRAGFVVSFDGPGVEEGRIDVRELAPALLSLGKVIDAANLAIYGEKSQIRVEAKAVSIGSFEVSIDAVITNWNAFTSFLDGADAQHAKLILEWIGIIGTPAMAGLVGVYRFLKGKRPARVVRAEGNIFRLEVDGRVLHVPLEVMRLYQDVAVNKAFNELISAVDSDNINKIEFRPDGAPREAKTLTLDRSDRPNFLIEEPPPSVVTDDTRRVALSIRSLAFQEGNKWRLFDGQNTITASIEDREFIDRVDSNLVRFAKGDILLCEVRTVQSQSRDGLKTEHTVLKVIEHRPAPTQIGLPFSAS